MRNLGLDYLGMIQEIKAFQRMRQEDAGSIRVLLDLLESDDLESNDTTEVLGFESCGLDWQVVWPHGKHSIATLVIRQGIHLTYDSSRESEIPVQIAQAVHHGIPMLACQIVKRFPAVQERFVSLLYGHPPSLTHNL